MKTIYSLIVTLVFASFSFATDFVIPNQAIVGAEAPIPFGEIIILSPSKIDPVPKYLATVHYRWKVLVDGEEKTRVKELGDGSIIFGGAPNQKITALLTVTYLYVVKDDKGVIIEAAAKGSGVIFANVKVVGPSPPPVPPTPPTPPTPIPPGKFGLTKFAYETFRSPHVILAEDQRKAAAYAMAGIMRSMASSVAAGVVRDIPTLMTQTKASNNNALRAVNIDPRSVDPWGKLLQDKLYDLNGNNTLKTVSDFADAFIEISDGLEKS